MSSPSRAILLGLDFGSTTSHALVASARILRNCVTGRMELGEAAAVYRSEPVFTPFLEDLVDEARLGAQLDRWIAESRVDPGGITAGGAIVTGLAAQTRNAHAIGRIVREKVGDAVLAVAEDPCLESWVSFMGSCGALSEAQPGRSFLNLDIGGGTTNLALGRAGEVTRTGCFFVGARHVRVEPGTYRLAGLSRHGAALLERLGIRKGPGEDLTAEETAAVVRANVELLEALVAGRKQDLARLLEQVPFSLPALPEAPVLTFSGGVGELVYRRAQGLPPPGTTAYGDLGIDLAEAVVRSPALSRDLKTHVPANLGRATVYGLTLRNTELSGTTLFLPRPGILPLRDLPILARLPGDAGSDSVGEAVESAKAGRNGACIQVTELGEDLPGIRRLGQRLAGALRERRFPAGQPLVVFLPRNVGKTLGSYATEWGRLDVTLVVVDELAARDARFASLGVPREGVIPVSFYGMR
jgi:ethanolamine utilization protein EutA